MTYHLLFSPTIAIVEPFPVLNFNTVPGTGGVGAHVLSQLDLLSHRHPISVLLISRSTKSLRAPSPSLSISLATWETDLAASTDKGLSPNEILDVLSQYAPKRSVFVDCTSSESVAANYPAFLQRGISVVTPNKKAFSGTLGLWKDIFGQARSPEKPDGGLVYHESSVGAGLPIISTLNDLVATGDVVKRIEGVFSGTMSFLFNSFAPVNGSGGKWSEEVKKAKEAGFTEPDPRDDLNGVDVARKLVILARLVGLEVESVKAFPVQSLIPKELESVESGDEFMQRLGEFDGQMEEVKKEAKAEGKVVRFVGSIDVAKKEVKVGLEKFETSHPIAGLKGSDNIVSFYTERYGSQPLVVQGAG